MRRAVAVAATLALLAGCATAPTPDQESEPQAPAETREPAPMPPRPPPAAPRPAPPPPPLPSVTIAAVGDIMMGTDFPDDRLPADDGASTFLAVIDDLRSPDITLGNLEGVLQDGGEPFKVCQNPSLCYLFRTPTRYATYLAEAGFDLISLANNHARDFGEEGRDASMASLAVQGIAHSGREGDIASLELAGRRVAFAAFAPKVGSYSLLDIPAAVSLVSRLKTEHDLVIVSFHGGAEGLDAMNVPYEMETYYGEDRGELRRFSRAVIDAGADLVIGHGPHVVRGLEIYAGRLIAYSLGNFATWQGISVAGLKGVAPILQVELDGHGRFTSGRIVSTRQTRTDGLRHDPRQQALDHMARLSTEDFGPNAPVFHPDGRITPPPPREP